MNQLLLTILAAVLPADVSQYKEPPAPIPALLDAAPSPSASLSPDRKWLLVMGRPALPPISEVAAPELRLAGLRIDPRTYAGSRDTFMTGLKLVAVPPMPKPVKGGKAAGAATLPAATAVQIPDGLRILQAFFSPDSKSLALILTSDAGLELAVTDVATGATKRLTAPKL